MSVLDRPTIEQADEVIQAAQTELGNVCTGRRKFTMCVPVQENDTDIVIGNALYIGRELVKENTALRERIRKLEAAGDDAVSDLATLVHNNGISAKKIKAWRELRKEADGTGG
jgi:hypothetical protein